MEGKLIKTDGTYILSINEYQDKVFAIADFDRANKLNKQKLSLKNCEAISNGYDLDEVVEDIVKTIVPNDRGEDIWYGTSMAVGKLCFQKAVEILGDKKFSEEDVIAMIEKSRETGLSAEYLILTKQQTEWDVEIEMDDVFIKNSDQYIDEVGVGNYSTHTKAPTLDIDGCLILRRI